MLKEDETAIRDDSPDAAAKWESVAAVAEVVSDLIAAQEQWLADHDAAIVAEITALRDEIRNLNAFPVMKEAESEP